MMASLGDDIRLWCMHDHDAAVDLRYELMKKEAGLDPVFVTGILAPTEEKEVEVQPSDWTMDPNLPGGDY